MNEIDPIPANGSGLFGLLVPLKKIIKEWVVAFG